MPGRLTAARGANPLYRSIGQAVRTARQDAGLSQVELADRTRLTRTSITNLESGRQQVPLHSLYAIAEELEVPLKELLPDERPADRYFDETDVDRFVKQLAQNRR